MKSSHNTFPSFLYFAEGFLFLFLNFFSTSAGVLSTSKLSTVKDGVGQQTFLTKLTSGRLHKLASRKIVQRPSWLVPVFPSFRGDTPPSRRLPHPMWRAIIQWQHFKCQSSLGFKPQTCLASVFIFNLTFNLLK